jgi:hypothetical protein
MIHPFGTQQEAKQNQHPSTGYIDARKLPDSHCHSSVRGPLYFLNTASRGIPICHGPSRDGSPTSSINSLRVLPICVPWLTLDSSAPNCGRFSRRAFSPRSKTTKAGTIGGVGCLRGQKRMPATTPAMPISTTARHREASCFDPHSKSLTVTPSAFASDSSDDGGIVRAAVRFIRGRWQARPLGSWLSCSRNAVMITPPSDGATNFPLPS